VAGISALTDDGYNDDVPPVITLNGVNPATVELGTTYVDAGATALDAYHGATTVTSSGTVDTSAVGSYTITYSATDLDGNTATATRTVNVVDTTAPVVTVTGDNPATVELGSTYTDAGATATDASGTVEVTSSGTVDSDTIGTYTITYSSTDASDNTLAYNINHGSGASHTFSNLTASTTYYFEIFSYTNSGSNIKELSKCSFILFLLALIPLTQYSAKFFVLSANKSIDCKMLWAINGLNTFNSK